MRQSQFNKKLKDFKRFCQQNKQIELTYDIETLKYNIGAFKSSAHRVAGKILYSPTLLKSHEYSVAFTYEWNNDIYDCYFPTFKDMFDWLLDNIKKKLKITMIAHNGNKFDNHFLDKSLKINFGAIVKNLYSEQLIDKHFSEKPKNRNKDIKRVIYEKRVKSKNNLEFIAFLDNLEIHTLDSLPKTNLSLATLGKKLLRGGFVTKEDLKTDFNYATYDTDHDMNNEAILEYCRKVFYGLKQHEMKYIRNDVYLLIQVKLHYSEIFIGKEWDTITFTKNIERFYTEDNPLATFQLLNQYDSRHRLNLSEFGYDDKETIYEFFKSFYRGGLNFYNQKYVGKIIKNLFHIDINSSYPYVMYAKKCPTKVIKIWNEDDIVTDPSANPEEEFTGKVKLIDDDDYTQFFRIEYDVMNDYLLDVESRVITQMFVKYYSTNGYVNLTNTAIKLLNHFMIEPIEEVQCIGYSLWENHDFASKDRIHQKYLIKTQGKQKKKVLMPSPLDVTLTDEDNELLLSPEEIDNAKVDLNGLYGIPALRPFFNVFQTIEDEIINFPKGFKNKERNIVFSAWVTAHAFYNLLSPLFFFTAQQIDDGFVYADTDSLFIKKEYQHLIPQSRFHKMNLGLWDIEHNDIEAFYALNHKKYALMFHNPKTNRKEIDVKSGGIRLSSFSQGLERAEQYNTNYKNFEKFIEEQFSEGVDIVSTKSVLNKEGVVVIYESNITLQKGGTYPVTFNKIIDEMKEETIERIAEEYKDHDEDILYIETPFGTISGADLHKDNFETPKSTNPMWFVTNQNQRVNKFLKTA
ncbi:hypothetical protein [Lactococcus petauri]|uniref:hypothetical protein n=1 Tax=Lactococcus petauri TaxID=1940789 RepID=UPI00211831FC|nr:hypothetical protein [Lactococcus petauri]MCR6590489.1 hypothetical protein [Lactococcus petauri]